MSVANNFPFQQALFNYILIKETENLNILRDEKLINNKIGVVLAFNGWKNILK
ncbi:16109_t:CDS:2 [Funneliformis mosseae]|uniref:16109_t:CDS:1 n=1 Tax=Funneliformis mosseae TaxID=27381 RepID=A0A9N9GNJ8_FUNMO|nr:16109_t:CDS:2 [Funneliformis mosseae]